MCMGAYDMQYPTDDTRTRIGRYTWDAGMHAVSSCIPACYVWMPDVAPLHGPVEGSTTPLHDDELTDGELVPLAQAHAERYIRPSTRAQRLLRAHH